MALKKEILPGTKYYYAVVKDVIYAKNVNHEAEFGSSHRIVISTTIRDTEDLENFEKNGEMEFYVPSEKHDFIDNETIEVPDTDENGDEVIRTVPKAPGYEKDSSYIDPFSIENMNGLDSNPIKIAYNWLKLNSDYFSTFTDI